MNKILLIEDNESQRTAILDRLEAEGYSTLYAKDGYTGQTALDTKEFDLVIMDIMLPGMNGYELVKHYRSKNGTKPIIFLSAKSDIVDKVSGLRIGADDYLVKPFEFAELTARIEVLLRRAKDSSQNEPESFDAQLLVMDDVSFGSFKIIFRQMKLLRDGKQIPLSLMEFKLLVYFMQHQDVIVKTDALMDAVWGYDSEIAPGTVYTHVSWLRKKLKISGQKKDYIQTIRNMGYIFSVKI